MRQKTRLLTLLVLLLTAATGAWAQDTWAEVVFTQAIEANDLAEDATFTADGSSFSVTLADDGNKMVIDANDCRFGTSTGYKLYSYRLKSGGASSATKNYLILNIPEAGKLRVAPRSASSSATDRTLKIEQGETVLYNDIVQESQAISITENEQEVKVYPYVEVPVTAGSVRVSYSAGMNFYGFGFSASSGGGSGAGYTVSLKDGTEDAANWTGKAGDGDYQALPLKDVAKGAALTLKYDGTKKVKSVKAVKKAEAPHLVIEDKNNYFGIGNQKFYFTEGETWTEAMANHPENAAAGWVIYNDRLRFKPDVYGYAIFILRSGDYYIIEDKILNQPIDTSKTYMFEGTNPT